jgi:hypothetical protein
MKYALLAAVSLVSCAAIADAQQAAPTAAPAPVAAPLDSTASIETLMASPKAKPIVLKNFPDLDKHPAYDQFKAISLHDLAPLSGGLITEEKIAVFDAELKAVK